jgi:RNA polymerase sigma-70 factor (ECF subfamily)
MLEAIAQKHMNAGLRRRLDAEDVVQSVFRTFFRRAQGGQFEVEDNERLWSLLCAITLTKVREKARFHRRQKRGLDREAALPATRDERGESYFSPAAPGLTPAEAAEFADQFERLMETLDEEERQLVNLKLQDYTSEQIAASMNVSERTVRRLLQRVKSRLERTFGASP